VETYCWLALPGQRSGRCPSLCVQAVGGGLGGQAAPVSDESALEVACTQDALYKSTSYLFYLTFLEEGRGRERGPHQTRGAHGGMRLLCVGLCQLFYLLLWVSHCNDRLLWLLLICGFCSLFTFLISEKLKYLLSHPKNVDFSVEYKHRLQFPSVTICNHNMFRWTP